MKKSGESLPGIVRISGKLPVVESAVLDEMGLAARSQIHSNPSKAIEQVNLDKRRIRIFLEDTSNKNAAKRERVGFFKRIDGTYYDGTKDPRVDLNYSQGDYTSGLAEVSLLSFMAKGLIEEVEEKDQTKNNIFFGYVNDLDTPCGLQIYTFNLKGKPEFIISHVNNLDKPKEDRQTTIYISPRLYRFLDDQELISTAEVCRNNPSQIKEEDLMPEHMARDLFATVRSAELNEKLRGLFLKDAAQSVSLSGGWDEFDKPEAQVSFSDLPFTPIMELPPDLVPSKARPFRQFGSAIDLQLRECAQSKEYIDVDLTNKYLIKYLNYLAEKVEDTTKNSPFTSKLFSRHATILVAIETLKESIAENPPANTLKEVEALLKIIEGSKNPELSKLGKEELAVEFNYMKQLVLSYGTRVHRVHEQLDEYHSNQLRRSSESTVSADDPLGSNPSSDSEGSSGENPSDDERPRTP